MIVDCRIYWGSHGCHLEDHARDREENGCVGAAPFYGDITVFYGEDAELEPI